MKSSGYAGIDEVAVGDGCVDVQVVVEEDEVGDHALCDGPRWWSIFRSRGCGGDGGEGPGKGAAGVCHEITDGLIE